MKRICQHNCRLTYKKAGQVIKQLKSNPEVCENCKIKPCKLCEYIYG